MLVLSNELGNGPKEVKNPFIVWTLDSFPRQWSWWGFPDEEVYVSLPICCTWWLIMEKWALTLLQHCFCDPPCFLVFVSVRTIELLSLWSWVPKIGSTWENLSSSLMLSSTLQLKCNPNHCPTVGQLDLRIQRCRIKFHHSPNFMVDPISRSREAWAFLSIIILNNGISGKKVVFIALTCKVLTNKASGVG